MTVIVSFNETRIRNPKMLTRLNWPIYSFFWRINLERIFSEVEATIQHLPKTSQPQIVLSTQLAKPPSSKGCSPKGQRPPADSFFLFCENLESPGQKSMVNGSDALACRLKEMSGFDKITFREEPFSPAKFMLAAREMAFYRPHEILERAQLPGVEFQVWPFDLDRFILDYHHLKVSNLKEFSPEKKRWLRWISSWFYSVMMDYSQLDPDVFGPGPGRIREVYRPLLKLFRAGEPWEKQPATFRNYCLCLNRLRITELIDCASHYQTREAIALAKLLTSYKETSPELPGPPAI